MPRVALLLSTAAALGFLMLVPLRRSHWVGAVDTVSVGASGNSLGAGRQDVAPGVGRKRSTRESAGPAQSAPSAGGVDAQPSLTSAIAWDRPSRDQECWLTGRMLDPAGQPVSNVWVESLSDGAMPRQHLATNGRGIFGGWVPAVGEVTLSFSKVNVGQSEPLEAVTLPAGTVDVGTVWLLEEGSLEGIVQLADGHPVPSVIVTATALSRDSLGGLSVSTSRTDDGGRFTVRGLAEGEFTLQVAGDDPYPLAAEVRARTRDTGVTLEVSALLFVARCVQQDEEPVLFRRVNLSIRPRGAQEGSTPMATFRKTPAVESIIVHAAVGFEYMLQAEAEDGRVYTAFSDASLTAGHYEVELRAESKELSSVTLKGPKLGAFHEGLLQVTSLKLEGERMAVSTRHSAFHPTVISTILEGLPKGSYEVEATLATSGYEVLVGAVRRFELAPPKDRVLTFTTTLGGRLELTFSAAPGHRGWVQSTVQIKREGEPDSSYTQFGPRVGGARGFGRSMVAPGLPIGSRVFEPGRYQVRLQSEGHLPKTVAVEVKAGVTTAFAIALDADLQVK